MLFVLLVASLLSSPLSSFTPIAGAPSGLTGIAGAPSGALVAWGEGDVYATRAGQGFTPVLAGKARVEAVAIDDDGTIYVARAGARLGVRDPNGHERWLRFPGASATTSLVVNGGRIVWLGQLGDELGYLVSSDRGRHFSPRPAWQAGNFDTRIALSDAGLVQLITAFEAPCGGGNQDRFVGAFDAETLTQASWGLDAPFDFVPGEDGYAYVPGSCSDDDDQHVCVVGRGQADPTPLAVKSAASPVIDDQALFVGVADGSRTWLVAGKTLLVASGGEARLVRELPVAARALAIAGKDLWVLGDGLYVLRHARTRTLIADADR